MIQREYIDEAFVASVEKMDRLLPSLLPSFLSIRIVVDGIDECTDAEQKSMLEKIRKLAGYNESSGLGDCKVLVSSRDSRTISQSLHTKPTIDLSQEGAASIQTAIASYVQSKMRDDTALAEAAAGDKSLIDRIQKKLLDKSDGFTLEKVLPSTDADHWTGMFLWVRLVFSMMDLAFTSNDVEKAVEDLPEGLDKV
jgi:hypothetical protein